MDERLYVSGGTVAITQSVKEILRSQHIELCDAARLTLLLDEPMGWARTVLDSTARSKRLFCVATNNPSSMYQHDLINTGILGVFTLLPLDQLVQNVQRCQQGEMVSPVMSLSMSPVELLTIRLVAKGLSNKEIACHRNTTEQVVKNTMSKIYEKLGVSSRASLIALYYRQGDDQYKVDEPQTLVSFTS
jgi:DNA-binding CsgD family transcriptional regulator